MVSSLAEAINGFASQNNWESNDTVEKENKKKRGDGNLSKDGDPW